MPDKEDHKDLDRELADVIVGRPLDFTVGRRSFRLYPLTLGKMLTLRHHIEALGIDEGILRRNPVVEGLRLAMKERVRSCHIVAVHATPNSRCALHDRSGLEERRKYIESNVSDSDLGALLLHCLTTDHTDELMAHIGLDKERERLQSIMAVKRGEGGSVSFGGLSLLGSFIGPLKEMGYSDDEILFERGYSYLRLMLADRMTSVFLSDEERSKLKVDAGGTLIDGDDPNSAMSLMGFFTGKGISTQR